MTARAALCAVGLGLAAGCAWLPLHRPGAGTSAEAIAARLAGFPEGPVPAAHLLLVSVAGLERSDYAPADGPAGTRPGMPLVARLAELGVEAERVIATSPPSAYPVHATLVTGRPPSVHGITADRRLGERGVRSERYSHASLLHATTLWQLARERRVPVAALDWPTTLGADVDYLLPDVGPARRGERYVDLLDGAASPSIVARVREAGAAGEAAGRPGPARDRLLVDVACGLAKDPQRPPALVLLRLTQTEPALLRFGPGSSEARAAFAAADAELARLLGCYDDAGLLADAAVVVVGDRTFEAVHSALRPNAALAEAGLLRLDPAGDVASWSALTRSNGGSAFVYAKDEAAAVDARHALGEAAHKTGGFRIVPASEMLDQGADPEAWFGLDALPGFGFSDEAKGALVGPSAERGCSGRLRADGSASPAFVAYGRGFRRGLKVPEMAQLDVAPTLASAVGMVLEGAEGRALVGLLVGGR